MTTTCKYSCKLCGIHRAPIDVPSREDEDVRVWMDATVRLIAQAHTLRSPHCQARELTELLIPTTGTDRIGGPIRQ